MENSSSTHFWVCAYPFVDSTLFVVPPLETSGSQAESLVTVFDADGEIANELTLSFPSREVGMLELDNLMGACKLEAGLKHGHALVQSPAGYAHFCRMHTREGASLLGTPSLLSAAHSTFFPLTFDEGRSYFVAVVNQTKAHAAVKCRLFSAKRSPETLITIPPLGSRVIHIETEFPDYAGGDTGKQLQAYVRLSTKSEGVLGAQLVERHTTKAEGGVFYAVG
jgi:hypothetical protein